MSDALPAGATSLEVEEGAELVGAVTDPAAAAAVTEDPEPEGVITTPAGEKMVKLSTLIETRSQLKGQIKAKDAEIAEIKPKAQRYDEVAPVIQQAMPIIEGIKRRPDLVAQLNQPAPAVTQPVGPLSAEEAVEYAKDFDLFKPDGSPDVDRAQRIAKRHEAMSTRSTQQAIAPFQQNEAQRQSATNFQHYAQMKDATGNLVDQKILATVWANVPAEQSANPSVANVLYLMALGQQVALGKGGKPPLAPVLTTEAPGGGRTVPTTITPIDTNIMKAAGISEQSYKDTAARFKPGQSNFLE